MKIKGINSILFGWHGVLDKRSFRGVEEKIAEVRGGLNETDLRVLKSRQYEYSAGTLGSEDFWSFVRDYFDIKQNMIHELRCYFVDVERNEPLWTSLPHLSKRYSLGIISNCPSEKIKIIYGRGGLNAFKGKIYFSCEHGLTKKDFAFYELALGGMGIPRGKKEKCLFVDSSVIDVSRAMDYGFKGHVYTDNARFLSSVNGSR